MVSWKGYRYSCEGTILWCRFDDAPGALRPSRANHLTAAGIEDVYLALSVERGAGFFLTSKGVSGIKALWRKSSMSMSSIPPTIESTGGSDWRAEAEEAARQPDIWRCARRAAGASRITTGRCRARCCWGTGSRAIRGITAFYIYVLATVRQRRLYNRPVPPPLPRTLLYTR
jgi:hypothetical protein